MTYRHPDLSLASSLLVGAQRSLDQQRRPEIALGLAYCSARCSLAVLGEADYHNQLLTPESAERELAEEAAGNGLSETPDSGLVDFGYPAVDSNLIEVCGRLLGERLKTGFESIGQDLLRMCGGEIEVGHARLAIDIAKGIFLRVRSLLPPIDVPD